MEQLSLFDWPAAAAEEIAARVERAAAWVDLAPHWDEVEAVGAARQALADRFDPNRSIERAHVVGFAGEKVIELVTGIPAWYGGPQGDAADCPYLNLDVKTTRALRRPCLRQNVRGRRWHDFFALVTLDEARRRARLVGWASATEVRAAPVEPGYWGPMHVLPGNALHPGLP